MHQEDTALKNTQFNIQDLESLKLSDYKHVFEDNDISSSSTSSPEPSPIPDLRPKENPQGGFLTILIETMKGKADSVCLKSILNKEDAMTKENHSQKELSNEKVILPSYPENNLHKMHTNFNNLFNTKNINDTMTAKSSKDDIPYNNGQSKSNLSSDIKQKNEGLSTHFISKQNLQSYNMNHICPNKVNNQQINLNLNQQGNFNYHDAYSQNSYIQYNPYSYHNQSNVFINKNPYHMNSCINNSNVFVNNNYNSYIYLNNHYDINNDKNSYLKSNSKSSKRISNHFNNSDLKKFFSCRSIADIISNYNLTKDLEMQVKHLEKSDMSLLFEKSHTLIIPLMKDSFSNYFVQELIVYINKEDKLKLIFSIKDDFLNLCLNEHSNHCIQKLIETTVNKENFQKLIMGLITPFFSILMYDKKGVYIIQKVLSIYSSKSKQDLIHFINQNLNDLMFDKIGVCVIKNVLSSISNHSLQEVIFNFILKNFERTVFDQYAHYIILYIIEKNIKEEIKIIIEEAKKSFGIMILSVYASRVINKLIVKDISVSLIYYYISSFNVYLVYLMTHFQLCLIQ